MYRFSDQKLKEIKIAIDHALKKAERRPVAAFDADGTLWASDMGESLFHYQYRNDLLPNLPQNPWEYYVNFHTKEPEKAYLWLAQINAGFPIEVVRKWAREAVKTHPEPGIFNGQKDVIRHLRASGVTVYVVTASIKWAVEPAAELYGIPKENVIGIQTKVTNGVVTEEQEGPITYRQGKVEGLLKATGGKPPFFAAGNTPGDLPLLESATHLRMVLHSAPEGHVNYNSEQEMLKIARERGWLWHSFLDASADDRF